FEREFAGIEKFEPISRTHPGFVGILHIGRNREAGYFYYVMEVADDIVSGPKIDPQTYTPKTLSAHLRQHGKLSWSECLQLGISLTTALAHLHRQGLVHRDIKPSNIIFISGAPKFADIGLVTSISEAATFVGTRGFIPPEGPGRPTADLYSLGRVLYEVSLGEDPANFPDLPPKLDGSGSPSELARFNEVIRKACD